MRSAIRQAVPPDQPLEIDVQRSRKQQEAQESVHQRLVEVDLTEEAFNRGAKVEPWNHPVDEHDDQGAHQCHEQRARGRWQTQEPVVHVAEHGGAGHQNRGDIEGVHAATPRSRALAMNG